MFRRCCRLFIAKGNIPLSIRGIPYSADVAKTLIKTAEVGGFSSPYWIPINLLSAFGVKLKNDQIPLSIPSDPTLVLVNAEQTTAPTEFNAATCMEPNRPTNIFGKAYEEPALSALSEAARINKYPSPYWGTQAMLELMGAEILKDAQPTTLLTSRKATFKLYNASQTNKPEVFNKEKCHRYQPYNLCDLEKSFPTHIVVKLRTIAQQNAFVSPRWMTGNDMKRLNLSFNGRSAKDKKDEGKRLIAESVWYNEEEITTDEAKLASHIHSMQSCTDAILSKIPIPSLKEQKEEILNVMGQPKFSLELKRALMEAKQKYGFKSPYFITQTQANCCGTSIHLNAKKITDIPGLKPGTTYYNADEVGDPKIFSSQTCVPYEPINVAENGAPILQQPVVLKMRAYIQKHGYNGPHWYTQESLGKFGKQLKDPGSRGPGIMTQPRRQEYVMFFYHENDLMDIPKQEGGAHPSSSLPSSPRQEVAPEKGVVLKDVYGNIITTHLQLMQEEMKKRNLSQPYWVTLREALALGFAIKLNAKAVGGMYHVTDTNHPSWFTPEHCIPNTVNIVEEADVDNNSNSHRNVELFLKTQAQKAKMTSNTWIRDSVLLKSPRWKLRPNARKVTASPTYNTKSAVAVYYNFDDIADESSSENSDTATTASSTGGKHEAADENAFLDVHGKPFSNQSVFQQAVKEHGFKSRYWCSLDQAKLMGTTIKPNEFPVQVDFKWGIKEEGFKFFFNAEQTKDPSRFTPATLRTVFLTGMKKKKGEETEVLK